MKSPGQLRSELRNLRQAHACILSAQLECAFNFAPGVARKLRSARASIRGAIRHRELKLGNMGESIK